MLRVAVPIAASFCPGVTMKYSGKFAISAVSVATAVGVASLIRMLQAADDTIRTRVVNAPNDAVALELPVDDKTDTVPSRAAP